MKKILSKIILLSLLVNQVSAGPSKLERNKVRNATSSVDKARTEVVAIERVTMVINLKCQNGEYLPQKEREFAQYFTLGEQKFKDIHKNVTSGFEGMYINMDDNSVVVEYPKHSENYVHVGQIDSDITYDDLTDEQKERCESSGDLEVYENVTKELTFLADFKAIVPISEEYKYCSKYKIGEFGDKIRGFPIKLVNLKTEEVLKESTLKTRKYDSCGRLEAIAYNIGYVILFPFALAFGVGPISF